MIGEEQDRESHRHHPSRKQGEGLDMFFRATLIAAAIATACSEHPYSGGTCHGHGDVQTHLT
jgi:hypothetical protein